MSGTSREQTNTLNSLNEMRTTIFWRRKDKAHIYDRVWLSELQKLVWSFFLRDFENGSLFQPISAHKLDISSTKIRENPFGESLLKTSPCYWRKLTWNSYLYISGNQIKSIALIRGRKFKGWCSCCTRYLQHFKSCLNRYQQRRPSATMDHDW